MLLTYENEAILAKQNGEDLDYIVPNHTFLIENPGAVLKDSDPAAKDWLDFILSDEGQTAFVKKASAPSVTSTSPASRWRAPTTRATRSRPPRR